MEAQEMKNAMVEAGHVMLRSEELAEIAICFASGKLKRMNVRHDVLNDLKRELRFWDMVKCQWRTPK